ncbi:hypothetical protein SGRI78S_00460 [Streptomyces griseus subsp. griseus]
MPRSRHTALFTLITVAALTLTGCAEPTEAADGGPDKEAARAKTPTTDVVSDVRKDEAACGAHGAQWAGAGGAPVGGRQAGLSLRQDGDDQAVIVRDDTGELSVIRPQGQAQTAEMGHPLHPETFGEPMGTGPDDSEHDDPP